MPLGQPVAEPGVERYGLLKATIEVWEQNRRQPDTGSRLPLRVIERERAGIRVPRG